MPRTKKTTNGTHTPATQSIPVTSDVEEITFKLRNGSERMFSRSVHGDSFQETAQTFEKTNSDLIIK